MSIKRNPNTRLENDTRRIILDGHLTGAYEPLPGTRSPIITRERAVELRARARRANLIVREREHPPRPEPTQVVYAIPALYNKESRQMTPTRCSGDQRIVSTDYLSPHIAPLPVPYENARVVLSW